MLYALHQPCPPLRAPPVRPPPPPPHHGLYPSLFHPSLCLTWPPAPPLLPLWNCISSSAPFLYPCPPHPVDGTATYSKRPFGGCHQADMPLLVRDTHPTLVCAAILLPVWNSLSSSCLQAPLPPPPPPPLPSIALRRSFFPLPFSAHPCPPL